MPLRKFSSAVLLIQRDADFGHTLRYAFNAWIALITYDTTYAPRFLVGNSVTVSLIVSAALTLTLALVLQRRDAKRAKHATFQNSALE